ncbi:hypothetical protein [Calderihabitans maritimus]|uniref:Uncharacterized protein n=1 Tax=Calderihabitans maritimus TaxID=1246530 RepID=A0A1Z5HX71_9FIRM|nr:hypothetical protein [Calderihabitans maritimus]GAW93880.1 hypothetical protein KKC1_30050 [Calderihabitans maritimus]
MRAFLRGCGYAYSYLNAGLFVTSFLAQTFAGLVMLAVLLLGFMNFFN